MKEIIEAIVHAIVDEPDLVSVREFDGKHMSILEVKVAKPDIGKIIGKNGRTAVAMRTILTAVSAKANKRTSLEILDNRRNSTFEKGCRNDRRQNYHECPSGKAVRAYANPSFHD